MRTRVVVFALAAGLAVALLAPTARAKGANAVTIEGVGVPSPISVTRSDGDGTTLMALADGLGFYAAVFQQQPDPMLKTPPTNDLGPALDVSWRLPTDTTTTVVVRQRLYPDAASGPLVYTEPGQPTFATTSTYGGWYQAQPAVRELLTRLGVPNRESLANAVRPAVVPPSPPSAPARGSVQWAFIASGAVVLGLALLAAMATGRRRARVAPA